MKIGKLGVVLVSVALLSVIPYSAVSNTQSASESVVLSKDNVVILNEAMMGEAVGKVISDAKALDLAMDSRVGSSVRAKKPLYLFLNTPGGSIQSGFEMFEALNGLNRPVHTITLFAASMGFQTVQNLGDRLILKNGVLMSHRAAGEFAGSFGGDYPSQLDSRYNFWTQRVRELDEQTVRRTKGKQTLQSYTKQYASETWITGTQAVEQGYADRIVTIKCDASLAGTTTHTLMFMGATINYDTDNCPINTALTNIKINMQTNKGVKSYEKFVAEGGEFGSSCLIEALKDPKKLCASNPTLTPEKLEDLGSKFRDEHDKAMRTPIRMSF